MAPPLDTTTATPFAASMQLPPPTATSTSHSCSRYRSAPKPISKSRGLGDTPAHTVVCRPASRSSRSAAADQPASQTPEAQRRVPDLVEGSVAEEDLRHDVLGDALAGVDHRRPGDRAAELSGRLPGRPAGPCCSALVYDVSRWPARCPLPGPAHRVHANPGSLLTDGTGRVPFARW